jgi:hypothetical protein
MAARARNQALLAGRDGESEQLAETRDTGAMHGRTHQHLGRFQIETAAVAEILEDDPQELVYFARDFPADRCGRFFSSGDSVSSAGRARQIFSFTSSNCWLSSRKP